jgi:glycerol uptake facilitator-like aquaporin
VTIARALTDSFPGSASASAPLFIAAQLIGTLAAYASFGWLFRPARPAVRTDSA